MTLQFIYLLFVNLFFIYLFTKHTQAYVYVNAFCMAYNTDAVSDIYVLQEFKNNFLL